MMTVTSVLGVLPGGIFSDPVFVVHAEETGTATAFEFADDDIANSKGTTVSNWNNVSWRITKDG